MARKVRSESSPFSKGLKMTKVMLEESCQADLKGKSIEVAVLPIGSCEVHGMHMPYGSDAFQAAILARRGAELAAARGAAVLVLPVLPYGCDENLMEFPYTVGLSPSTILKILDDLVGGLAHHGIRKVLLLNGHGGNCGTLDAALRELYGKHKVFLARLCCGSVAPDVVEAVRETSELEHADEMETSVALALFPQLVIMSAAEPAPSNPSRLPLLEKHGGKFSRPWHLFTRNGGVGDPTKASRAKGEKVVQATVTRIADILVELCALKYDERFPYGPRRRGK
jgi:creatinine amidohydrolase